jgi:hypothetical protein
MRPVSLFANRPDDETERLRAELRGRWRMTARAVMVLLSVQGLPPAQIAGLLDCHPAHGALLGSASSTAKGWRGWASGPGPGGRRRAASI